MNLDHKGEPILTVGREVPFSNDNKDVVDLREFTKKAVSTVKEALRIEILSGNSDDLDGDNFLTPLQICGVAHELALKCQAIPCGR